MAKYLSTIILAVGCMLDFGAFGGEAHVTTLDNGAKVVCEDGVCRLVEAPEAAAATDLAAEGEEPTRLAQGYMSAEKFIAFLDGSDTATPLPYSLFLLPFFLVLAGLALNLTPCVLPMIPVNLIIIGKSAKRGIAYGLGIALAYGALGAAAAGGGMVFGTIQSSPWFNAVVAVIFAALALSLSGAFAIDFSKRRPKPGSAFFMGIVSALLAGACVAPVVASVLLLSADLFAKGHRAALALPLFVGIGMALPWPFLGAGMKLLPKPGAWMKWVNRIFAIAVAGFALWYASLAWRGFMGTDPSTDSAESGAVEATPETFAAALNAAKRPVLVDCWASWCKNCAAMDRVMAEEPVRKELERFTVIRLRAEDIGALRKLPAFNKVKGLPAFAIFQ